MLRAGVKDPENPLVLCGLTDENVTRLKAGRPIHAELRSFGVDLPGRLVIIHGTTEADLEHVLTEGGLISPSTRQSVDPDLDQMAAIRARHAHVLIATVGLPRSGKSTWARDQGYPIVNPDAIRLSMHGQRFVERAEPLVWAVAKCMVRSLFTAGHRTVILDATNTTRKRRDEWRSADWGLFFKPVGTPRDVCVERARSAGDDEIEEVINRMAAGFEPLGPDEPRWPGPAVGGVA